jgi:hypothetical protein
VSNVLTSLPGYIISALTIAGLIVLVALKAATYAEAAPLIGVLAGGHLVAGTSTPSPAATTAAVAPPAA